MILLLQTWLFSLCRKPDSALSPSSTPKTSLVLTRYWLLCSSACSASTSAQSRCQAQSDSSEGCIIRPRAFNGLKPGDGLRCIRYVHSHISTFRTEQGHNQLETLVYFFRQQGKQLCYKSLKLQRASYNMDAQAFSSFIALASML